MPYTPKQVSEMLSIPESSLRRLSREFAAFLSKQKGRNRKYIEQDISVLQRVREATSHGQTIEEIKIDLSIKSPETDTQPADGDSLMLVPAIAGEFSRIDDHFSQVARELELLRADRQTDRDRIAKLERLAEWAAQPWWKRLFSRPPE